MKLLRSNITEMKIFHYANIDDWKEMNGRRETVGEEVCLRASRRVGREFPEAWNTGAIFGLLSPVPEKWVNNATFALTWNVLMRNLGGRFLLEIDIDPEKEQGIYVLDRGYLEGFLCKDVENGKIPEKYAFQNRYDAEKAYIGSKVPLKEYLEKELGHAFSLPEVIMTNDIPMNRLSVSNEQPLLELKLRGKDCENKRNFIRRMREIPELDVWYQRKLSEAKPQESGFATKYFR